MDRHSINDAVSALWSNESLDDGTNIDPVTVISRIDTTSLGGRNVYDYARSAAELSAILRSSAHHDCTIRIYLIHQDDSWSPLNLSTDMLRQICNEHDISPELLKTLQTFRERTSHIDVGYAEPFRRKVSTLQAECVFVLKYPEKTFRKDYEPWSIRQSALYQCHKRRDRRYVYLLISPIQDSAAEKAIFEWIDNVDARHDCHPAIIGEVLWKTYFDNWKEYLNHYEKKLWALSTALSRCDAEHDLRTRPGYLHFLKTRLIPVEPAIDCSTRSIGGYRQHVGTMLSQSPLCDDRALVLTRLDDFIVEHNLLSFALRNYVKSLFTSCDSTSLLLEQLIGSKSRIVTQHQSEHMTDLTKMALKDSAAIRCITVITMVYLSPSAIGTIMDMPFFHLDNNEHLVVSDEIWIFFVVVLVSIGITFAYWQWLIRGRRQQQSLSVTDHRSTRGQSLV